MDWKAVAASAKLGSADKVADAMTKSPSWPKGEGPENIRSIGNEVRRLLKGEPAPWWNGRGKAYRQALGDALGLSMDEVVEALAFAAHRTGRAHGPEVAGLPFKMLLDLGIFDPEVDELFPGIPAAVLRLPKAEVGSRVWWWAPPGAGKSFVSAWLRSRGWTAFETDRWSAVESRLRPGARHFVELRDVDEVPEGVDLPVGASLCVAAPFRRPQHDRDAERTARRSSSPEDDEAEARWRDVETPSPQSWIEPLVKWVRIQRGVDALDEKGALKMLREHQAAVVTPGDAIALLGVYLELTPKERRSSPITWIDRYVSASIERLRTSGTALGSREVEWLRHNARRILRDLTAAQIRSGRSGPLGLDEWAGLVPELTPRDLDAPAQVAHDESLPAADRLRVLQELLPPVGRGAVDLLKRVRLLQPATSGTWEVYPAWARLAVFDDVLKGLAHGGPEDVGALVLNPATVERTLDLLVQQIDAGDLGVMGAALENPNVGSPEQVAAAEMSFIVIGLAVLQGTQVPQELLRRAWGVQGNLAVQRQTNGPPGPRSIGGDRGITGASGYILAALAISAKLPIEVLLGSDPRLAPWLQPSVPSGLEHVLEVHVPDAWMPRVFELGGRLFERFGRIGHGPTMQRPALLVDAARPKDASHKSDATPLVPRLDFSSDVLRRECDRLGVSFDEVIRWCWGAWATAGMGLRELPPVRWLYVPDGWDRGFRWPDREVEIVWSLLPVELPNPRRVDEIFAFIGCEHGRVAWEAVGEGVREAWFRWRIDHHQDQSALVEPYLTASDEQIEEAVRAGVFEWVREGAEPLWDAHGDLLLRLLRELLRELGRDGRATVGRHVMWSAPQAWVARVLDAVESDAAELPDVNRGAIVRWLHQLVSDRGPSWRRAFGVLATLAPVDADINGVQTP